MENPNLKKELTKVLSEFEKAREWEWDDLRKWLKKVKKLLEKYPNAQIPDKYTLAKRLSQCLNPSLPPGLHYITITIYQTLLNGRDDMDDLAIYSGGILPYFQYASLENKENVLNLISYYFVEKGSKISFALPGIVTAILPGLDEEESNPEIEQRTMEIFDRFAVLDKIGLFGAMWQALLRSPRVRRPALLYLSRRVPRTEDLGLEDYLPQKNLLVNSLIAAINDEHTVVQRAALELLLSHFPVNISEEILNTHEKTVLLEAVLKLLKQQDMFINKLIWLWCFQTDESPTEDILEEIKEYLVEALKSIFGIHPTTKEESLLPMKILEPLLGHHALAPYLLREITVTMLTYVENYKDDKDYGGEILEECLRLLRNDQCVENGLLIWDALNYSLDEHLHGDALKAIEVIKFCLKSFPIEVYEVTHIKPLLENLLTNMHNLSQQSLSSALDLANAMVQRLHNCGTLEIQDSIYCFHRFFVQLCKESSSSIEDLRLASSLTIYLSKYSPKTHDLEWKQCFLDCMDNKANIDVALIGIDCILKLIKVEENSYIQGIESERNENLCESVMKRLWKLLDKPDYKAKAVELILMLYQADRSIFYNTISRKLLGNSREDESFSTLDTSRCFKEAEDWSNSQEKVVKKLVKNINRFTVFWNTASSVSSGALVELLYNGDGIFYMLDHLDHHSPEIRDNVRKWLIDSLSQFSCVLDPIFVILMQPDSLRRKQNGFYVIDKYDDARILDAFKKLRRLIRNGGEIIFTKTESLLLTPRIEELLNQGEKAAEPYEDVPKTYLELMVEVALRFIMTDTYSDEDFVIRNQTVQAAACEFLDLILSQKNTDLAYRAVYRILACINKSIDKDDCVMQLLLLNVIQVIFFSCKLETSYKECIELLRSKQFGEVYLKALHTNDSYVRSHWISFITNSLPIFTRIDNEKMMEYIEVLIENFCKEIQKAEDSAALFDGLQAILHHSLDINKQNRADPNILIHNYPELQRPIPQAKTSFLDGVKKIFRSSEEQVQPNPYFNIFKNFEMVLNTCIKCISETNNNQTGYILGCPSCEMTEGSAIGNNHILDLLNPVMAKFPAELMIAAMDIWMKRTIMTDDLVQEMDSELLKLMSIIISLDTSPAIVMRALNQFTSDLNLAQYKRKNDGGSTYKEAAVAHFAYCLYGFYPKTKLDMDSDDKREFWGEAVKLTKELDLSPFPVVHIWIIELFALLVKRIKIEDALADKNIRKLIQEYFQKLMNTVTSMALSVEGKEIKHPFPPSIYFFIKNPDKKTTVSLKLVALQVLKSAAYNVVKQIWQKEGPDKVTSVIQSPASQFFQALTGRQAHEHAETVAELVSSLLVSGGLQLARVLRKDIIDFFTSPEFFDSMNGRELCLRNWSQIINNVCNFCYPDKNVLINELLGKTQNTVFSNITNVQKIRILKCISYLIYSGEVDDYQACMQLIVEKLIEFIRVDESLIPGVFLGIRVLMLKLSPPAISEIWPRLWPHVLSELMQIVEKNENLTNCMAALKFLDLISTINNEEFHMYQWIFFLDAFTDSDDREENKTNEFDPLVPRCFGKPENFDRFEDKFESLGRIEKRKLVVDVQEVKSQNELKAKAIRLSEEILRLSEVRCEPDMENIRNLLERDFLSPTF